MNSLRRVRDGVWVQAGSNAPRLFDAAVVAVHPDQALLLLDDPNPWERAVLGAIPYSTNQAQLHADESVLPGVAGRAHRGITWLPREGPCRSQL